MEGVNPISQFKFGVSVRSFNMKEVEEQQIVYENWKPIWLYGAMKKDDKVVSVGECWDLAVVTGRGQTIEEAVDNAYDNYGGLVFKEKYSRTKEDFLSDYPTSLIRRYKATVGTYFEGPLFKTKDDKHTEDMEQFKGKVK